MNLKQALKRIEELEARVRALELAPREVHYHNDYVPPTYAPQPVTTPVLTDVVPTDCYMRRQLSSLRSNTMFNILKYLEDKISTELHSVLTTFDSRLTKIEEELHLKAKPAPDETPKP